MKALRLGLRLLVAIAGWVAAAAGAEAPAGSVVFQFRLPKIIGYRVEPASGIQPASVSRDTWVKAAPESAPGNSVLLGARVVLQMQPGSSLGTLLNGSPLTLARTVSADVFILQAPDVWTALREAERLGQLAHVIAAYPVRRQMASLHGAYAAHPNDPHFGEQWYLENRMANGTWLGMDLNVRAAWPFTYGEGVTIAFADDGVEMTHPELAPRVAIGLHYNFNQATTNGMPLSANAMHATSVAGLALAEGNNRQGMIGVAPAARLASWVIFDSNDYLPSDEHMMDMFQFHSNVVAVQNHSWGNASIYQLEPSLLEQTAISNAVTYGRNGLGVVMVRAGGNQRNSWNNVTDDGYAQNPRVIAVAAIRQDGRAASYSTPGAALLVAAPSGDADEGFPGLFTTDRQKSQGYNSSTNEPDYAFGENGFSGTSAATPQISGVVALILSVNPKLSYRDVQQILIHAARHFGGADPDLTTNGAGLVVSHNDGFGVPDAGLAVRLARAWINRPPLTQVTLTSNEVLAIPDDGVRVLVGGAQVPDNLRTIYASPAQGPHPDAPTASLSLVDVGMATNDITANLAGRGALIQRGVSTFAEKIQKVAGAGAAFAIVYNNRDVDQRVFMDATSFVPIPAVFISQTNGEALRDFLLQQPDTPVQLRLESARYTFGVTNTLSCEHVAVRLATDHPRRGDLRLTLLSPAGTRSVFQQLNNDTAPGPTDWTYYSTHHFYESSAGTWTVEVTDEDAGSVGSVQSVSLILSGVPITDTDHDGLDDAWEMEHFHSLSARPEEDPDGDGYSNLREQIMGTNPLAGNLPFQVDVSSWNVGIERLSWPGTFNSSYQIWAGNEVAGPLSLVTNLPGRFPETEWFITSTNGSRQFFRIQAAPLK